MPECLSAASVRLFVDCSLCDLLAFLVSGEYAVHEYSNDAQMHEYLR